MNYEKWLQKNTTSLKNKTVAITGSTGGLGKEICLHLLQLDANLVLIDRNKQKQDNLKEFLLQKYSNGNITGLLANHEDFASIKKVAENLKNLDIDILILNAGAYKIPQKTTTIGYDNIFQINFLSPYYILKELLPILDKKQNSKVVIVGSIAHKKNRYNKDDIQFIDCKKSVRRYGNAKRLLMFGSTKLAEQYKNVKISVTHPGITLTNIISNFSKPLYKIVKPLMKIIFDSPQKASLNIIKGIFSNTANTMWIGPKYFDIWGLPKLKLLKTYNNQEAINIFKTAEDIYNNIKNF